MVNLSDLSGGGSSGGTSSTLDQAGFGGMSKPAKYVLASNNSSQSAYEFMFYDQDFNVMMPSYENYSAQDSKTISPGVRIGDSSFAYHQSLVWNQWSRTQDYPSSNSGWYFSSTIQSGLTIGPGWADVFADGSWGNNSTSYNYKKLLNNHFFNSDHTDSSKVYFYYNTKVCCYTRSLPHIYAPTYTNCRSWSPPTAGGQSAQNLYGMSSYNNTRKEFIGIFYNTGNFNWRVWHYKGIDFDTYPSPHDAFNNATTATWFDLDLNSNPSSNNTETRENIHPVLCDDGTCHLVIMDTGQNLKRYTFTPPTDGTDLTQSGGGTAVTATLQVNLNLSTSYGTDQGSAYGSQEMESGDRKSVAVYCPYYYYHSGLKAFCMSRESTSKTVAQISRQDSSEGCQIFPYRDDGFAVWRSSNVYASNPQGSYVQHFVNRDSGGMVVDNSARKYLPMFPKPNTTNYPPLCAVNDYWCHPYRDLR